MSILNAGRRVAITGLGIFTSLGANINEFWQNLLNGRSGISKSSDEFTFLPCRISGIIREDIFKAKINEISACCSKRNATFPGDWRRISRASALGVIASVEALDQANWRTPTLNNESQEFRTASYRAGVHFGTGMEGITQIMHSTPAIHSRKYAGIGPHELTRSLSNMPAAIISLIWGLRGPCMASNTACATGLHSIGDAYRMIQSNEADLVLAGGCESTINPWAVAAFCRIRALSTRFNDSPDIASRPFDALRDGFVMSEGAAAVVLQAWPPPPTISQWQFSDQSNTSTKPIAEVIGYGRSGDAHNLVSPEPVGDGAYRSMLAAICDAGISESSQIGHINCHATSTPLGDEIELAAIGRLLADTSALEANGSLASCEGSRIAVNSIKGHTGHTLGAAGALETVYTALAVSRGQLPGNLNLTDPIRSNEVADSLKASDSPLFPDTASIDRIVEALERQTFLPRHSVEWPKAELGRRTALTNSFGFGGTNGTLVICEWND